MDNQKSIFKACEEENIEVVKFLLEKGVDTEAKNNYGDSPLIIASCNGNIEIVKLLLEKGADIEAINSEGNMPLITASSYGNIEIVKFLIEKGADTSSKNNDGNTFYNELLHKSQEEEIEEFIKDIEERKRMIKPYK